MTAARARRRIVIVGAGFAALTAVRRLRRRAPQHAIIVVAPRAEFVYQPSLIWLPTGLRRASDLVLPLQRFFARQRVEFIAARATGLDRERRLLLTDDGPVEYDALLIASGGRLLKSLPGIEHALPICGGIAAAEAIGERLAAMTGGRIVFGFGANPKQPAAMRGGPIFELLFGIDTWLRRRRLRDRFTLAFVNAASEPGKRLGDRAVQALLAEMKRRDVELHLGQPIQRFDADGVETAAGRVPADLILFMPGLTGPDWAGASGLPLSDGGFFDADPFGRVNGTERIFVAGDAGSFPGPDWAPKQAHMADLQARAAADNLLRSLDGESPSARFRHELICIVDALDSGMLVYRDERRAWMLPRLRLFHWLKRAFEWNYLRPYRG